MHMKNKIKVGILGATGMVGQRFITLLINHPWFEVVCVAASKDSAGKTYAHAVDGKWKMEVPVPDTVAKLIVKSVYSVSEVAKEVDFVFCALDMDKDAIKKLEDSYAASDIPVVSNNSANRWTPDIPMIIPEINSDHLEMIAIQRKNRGWKKGFIAVKPNCSIQSYVMILTALQKFKPENVIVTSMQAISGAGKTFATWPEMVDNINPYIGGEEEKSENEPLKIWGKIQKGNIIPVKKPVISATCVRVPVSNGHMASVSVSFANKPSKKAILTAITGFKSPIAHLSLPSSPKKTISYFAVDDRPQTKLDRDYENGMGISMGRLREGKFFDWQFISLSHNTVRGAAGGAILLAELLTKKGYIS